MVFDPRQTIRPKPDELEVSLFGPGVGECIALHVGLGEWMVVDSCIDRQSGRPIALDYLRALGYEPATSIKSVVITHWHDDHMRGAAAILREAPSAGFLCSSALRQREYLELVGAANLERVGDVEIPEFLKVIEELKAKNQTRLPVSGIHWVKEGETIYRRERSDALPAVVLALSPSSDALTNAYLEFARLLPQPRAPKRRSVEMTANRVAVALWVEFGKAHALLGADLEECGLSTMGWQAVLNLAARPDSLAASFKVAHHGSENGHYDPVWTDMLEADPAAILAPYLAGRKPLPSEDDIARIKSKTHHAYATTPPHGFHSPRRDPAVEKMIGRKLRAVAGDMGQVRLRGDAASGKLPSVELFGPAIRL